jgi:apolipoprotein N-acyltransferase
VRVPGTAVVTGVLADRRNQAVLVSPSGARRVYVKQHLVPGQEDDEVPGDGAPVTAAAAGVRVRLLVCRDLYYPRTVRAGGTAPRPLVVPAWDFGTDGRRASELAVVRAVENGVPIVRPSADGELLGADDRGRITGRAVQAGRPDGRATGTATVLAAWPAGTTRTPYVRFGDWFAWLCLATAAGALLTGLRRRPHDAREELVDPAVPGDLGVERGGEEVVLPDGDDAPVGRTAGDPREHLDA